jgi:uncharacterized protein YacL (UPF0231 family)
MKTKKENQMEWLQNEIKKDNVLLNNQKFKFIKQIKGMNKEEILPIEKKITLWERIKTVLRIY